MKTWPHSLVAEGIASSLLVGLTAGAGTGHSVCSGLEGTAVIGVASGDVACSVAGAEAVEFPGVVAAVCAALAGAKESLSVRGRLGLP